MRTYINAKHLLKSIQHDDGTVDGLARGFEVRSRGVGASESGGTYHGGAGIRRAYRSHRAEGVSPTAPTEHRAARNATLPTNGTEATQAGVVLPLWHRVGNFDCAVVLLECRSAAPTCVLLEVRQINRTCCGITTH